MTIYLIRHGQTEANEQRLYCGRTDLPLSPKGREALQNQNYEIPENLRFITSGLRRCNETLGLLFGDVPYEVVSAFREMDFGAFEMHSYDQLKDDPDYQIWLTGDNESNVTPGGESGNQMTARVIAALHQVMQTGNDTVIVTHGGVIAAIMAERFPREKKTRYQWQPKPGCGYRLHENHYDSIP